MAFAPGQSVGRYRVISLIGSGGMATVYRVHHAELGTAFALKVLQVQTPSLAERLRREGRAQGRLQHPNVLRVVDLVELPTGPALILDFANGPPLWDWIQAVGRPTLAQADFLVQQVSRGMAAAHAQGIVHRDLKPGNVLLHLEIDRVLPKVADFGLAKVTEDDGGPKTRTGATLGTPEYMAPEQVRDPRVATPASDVYALGALAFELLTGQVPFKGKDLFDTFQLICTAPRPEVRAISPEVPPALAGLVERCLAVDPAERPADAAAFLAAWTSVAVTLDREAANLQLTEIVRWVDGWVTRRPVLSIPPGATPTYASDTDVHARAPGATPPPSAAPSVPAAFGGLAVLIALTSIGTTLVLGLALAWAGYAYVAEQSAVEDDDLVVLPPLTGSADAPVRKRPAAPRADRAPAIPAGSESGGKPAYRTPRAPADPTASDPPEVAVDGSVADAPLETSELPLVRPEDWSACADLRSLEAPASQGALSSAQSACLDRRIAESDQQTDRDYSSRLLVRDAQVRMLAGASCAAFDDRLTRHLGEISRSDAGLMYTWARHLATHHPDRDEEAFTWADRALENKGQLGEGSVFTDKVARLLQVKAHAATDLWARAQERYLAAGRPPDLEPIEVAARARAKSAAREWLEFLTSARRDTSEARNLCVTASGSATCEVQ